MEGFTYAYIKEAFVATLLRFASQPAEGPGSRSESDDPTASPFYDEFQAQVQILKEQMAEKPSTEPVKTETSVVIWK